MRAKRSNPVLRRSNSWIALSQGLLAMTVSQLQPLQRSVNRGLGGNAKMLEQVLGRRAGAKTVHADEFAILSDHLVPAPAHRGLDRDLDLRIADDGALLGLILRQQQFQ